MNNYNEIAKTLLSRFYSPVKEENRIEEFKTTEEILLMIRGVIPETPFDQHDVFQVMNELGFQIELTENILCWKMYRI